MDLFTIANQQVVHSMREQFRETPEAEPVAPDTTPRAGITTATRRRLSAGLRALAAAIEPRQPLTPEPTGAHR